MDTRRALSESCDVWFYEVGKELGIDRIARYARMLGLGSVPMEDMIEAKEGLVPTVAWKNKRYGTKWLTGETALSSIGQGYVLATPLQLAVMMSRLVNGGLMVRPTMLRRGEGTPVGLSRLGVSPRSLATLAEAMELVVNDRKGTAWSARIRDDGWRLAGKTGTTQVTSSLRHTELLVEHDEIPWRLRNHALFVGYAPAARPRWAISTVIEHGESGAYAAVATRDVVFSIREHLQA